MHVIHVLVLGLTFVNRSTNRDADMDVKYKEKLQRNSSLIIEEIDAEQLCLYLNRTLLTRTEVDKVYAATSRQERAKRLLDLVLSSKDAMAYQHFRYALRERYAHIVSALDDTAVVMSDNCAHGDAQNGVSLFDQARVLKRRDSLILNLQTEDVADYMKHENVLTAHDCSKIRAGVTNEVKARVLLDILAEKGPQAYKIFSLAVQAKQPQLAKIFENTDSQ